MDEQTFRRRADAALQSLNQSLIVAEESADFEVEESNGVIHISFEDPPGRFVISPNGAVSQIWISALSTSFKLDWSDEANDFVLTKTGERMKALMSRLINEQMGGKEVELK
jgi:iron donor protein CyaY